MADVNVQQNAPPPAPEPRGGGGLGWLWALLLVIVIALLIWFVVGRGDGVDEASEIEVIDEASDIEIDVPEQIDVDVNTGGDDQSGSAQDGGGTDQPGQ